MSRKSLAAMIKAGKEDTPSSFLASLTKAIGIQEQREPSKTFKPSSLSCIRRAVFEVLGEPRNTSPQTAMSHGITSAGTFIHEYIQSQCLKMSGFEYINVGDYVREKELSLEVRKEQDIENGEYETKLYSPEYNISFLCDGIIKRRDKYFILEIKSCGNQKMFHLEEVPDEYKQQAISYSQLLQIPDVLFLFVNRDLFQKKAFMYSPTREEIRYWQDKLAYGFECVREKKVPEKPKWANNKFCQYCKYVNSCNYYGWNEVKWKSP